MLRCIECNRSLPLSLSLSLSLTLSLSFFLFVAVEATADESNDETGMFPVLRYTCCTTPTANFSVQRAGLQAVTSNFDL